MSLGSNLKEEREKRNWSQVYVAKKVGITNAVLSNYERDIRDPDTETLKKLANLYDVSLDYLLENETNDSEEKRRTSIMKRIATEFPDIDLMFNDIKSWSAKEFEELYDYIKFKESQKEKK